MASQDRDLTTEARAVGTLLLGWPAGAIEVHVPLEVATPLRFLTWQGNPTLGLYVELTAAYEPELLLVELKAISGVSAEHLEAFKGGERTELERLAEVRRTMKGGPGPSILELSA